ncbi:DUF418 domain-containing protein [Spiractinospora alimapuensis]|nr:DUF418 domain-containing protein [Spiractinospora alimapuensis]
MLLLIAMAYAGVYAGVGFGTSLDTAPTVDRVATFLTVLVLDNRAFPMFAILFGYGMAWLVARQLARGESEREVRRLLRRRAVFLFLFGAVNIVLVFPGEILTSYGLAGLLLGWLLFRSDVVLRRAVVVLAGLSLLTVTVAMIGYGWSLATGDDLAEAGTPGYLTTADWIERVVSILATPLFIAFAYPLLLLVVLGFVAGRRGLLNDPERHRVALARIAVAGISASLLGALPAAAYAVGLLAVSPVTVGALMALQVHTGVLGGAGYAALFGLIALRLGSPTGVLSGAVAAMGQRSLTFYLLNSILVTLVLHPQLGGLGTHVGMAGALAAAFGAWLVSLGAAYSLDRADRPGPADALLRRLVYRPRRRSATGRDPS